MQKRDHKSTPRDRLSSSGSSLSDLSEDELAPTDHRLDTKDVNDPRLIQAATAAAKENTMTPLIKEELRYTILNRRSQQGLGDIVFEEKKPLPKKPMTPQEKERKARRQEQNRRAAKKCRKKKKDTEVSLLKAYHEEKDKHASLETEVNKLKQEKEHLKKLFQEHMQTCSATQGMLDQLQTNLPSQTPSSTVTREADSGLGLLAPEAYPLYDVQSPDVISPGPSEPFTPGMDTDGRYFMYPDTGVDNCKTAQNVESCHTTGILNDPEIDFLNGNEEEECLDIQSYLNNATFQPFANTVVDGNMVQVPNNTAEAEFNLQLPPFTRQTGFTYAEPNNVDSEIIRVLSSLTGGIEDNTAPFPQDDAMIQSGLMHHWDTLPFSDMPDMNGNRH